MQFAVYYVHIEYTTATYSIQVQEVKGGQAMNVVINLKKFSIRDL